MVTERTGAVHALRTGELTARLRAFVFLNARAIALVSLPLLAASFALLVLLHRAGLDPSWAIDYQVYRWAVHTWLAGGDIVNYAPTVSIGRPLPWVYPPFALLPLLPFALLPFTVGLVALYLVDFAAMGAAMYVVIRRLWPAAGRRGAVAVAMALLPFTLFLEPVYSSFGLGQVNIALMGLVIVDCLARAPRWPRGALIGIAAAIKLTPAAFLLFFLVRKDFRASAVAVATAVLGTLAGFALNLQASMDYWFNQGPAQGVSGSAFHTNQAVLGELTRLGLPSAAKYAVWFALAGALTAVVALAVRRVEPALGVMATGLLSLLISPTSWSDHWVWCVPGLVVLLGHAVRRLSVGWLLTAGWTLLTVVVASFGWVPNGPPWTPLEHLLGNPYLVWGLVLIGLLARHCLRKPAAEPVPEPVRETAVAAR
ncbi:glycosyltransferase 87 family protein [Saccharopolyspora griseoalba]|uniref:Glycosyltransferase 87 family protein n=1 Tax=Saccharopolyspora griseoalba TaxID=1431848 RepID=A0ABW2LC43_9PSEU